jgi:hypothetical protein
LADVTSDAVDQEAALRRGASTPAMSVDRSTEVDCLTDVDRSTEVDRSTDVDRSTEVDRSTDVDRSTEVGDSDFDDSESSPHKRLGLIRYRSLRDHNGRYYLVVKIR